METGCGPRALLPPDSEGCGDATSSGLACQVELPGPEHAWRLTGQTKSSVFPLRDRRIGDGEVVRKGFVGPLAGQADVAADACH